MPADTRRGKVVFLVFGSANDGICHVADNLEVKRELGVLDNAAGREKGTWHAHLVIEVRVGALNDGQLIVAVFFHEVGCATFKNGHAAFDGEQARKEFAEHHHDETQVQDKDTGAFPGQLETKGVGS